MATGRITLPVAVLEFEEGGNTIWIHSPEGSTTLRIKTSGKVTSRQCDTSPVSHGDIMVDGDICICIGAEEKETPRSKKTTKKLRPIRKQSKL